MTAIEQPGADRRMTRLEWGIVLGAALVLVLVTAVVKLTRIQAFEGDTALFFQMMHNLLKTGIPMSQIGAEVQSYTQSVHYPVMTAATLAHSALAPPVPDSVNMFTWHAYYIFYALAPFCAIFSIPGTLLTSFVLAFVALLVGVYVLARSQGVTPLSSAIAVLLVASYPAWWCGLLWGQVYPDRLFVFLGFALMALAARVKTPRWLFIVVAVLASSITERAPIVAGISVLLYVLLWWRSVDDRRFKLGASLAMLVYGLILLKFVIHNPYNQGYIPDSLGGIIQSFFVFPNFAVMTLLLLVLSLPLLALAAFEWRALAIAFVAMLPNIIGNLGGAEKIGWVTHYSSYFFPILVWAAVMGLAAFERRVRVPFAAAGALAVGVIFLSCIDPFSFAPIRFSGLTPNSSMLPAYQQAVQLAFSPSGRTIAAVGGGISRAIPPGSSVTTVEGGMTYVYNDRDVHLFPVGLDTANYAIVSDAVDASGRHTYGGFVSFLPHQQARIDALLVDRMKRDHYDFAHAKAFPELGLAVVRRE